VFKDNGISHIKGSAPRQWDLLSSNLNRLSDKPRLYKFPFSATFENKGFLGKLLKIAPDLYIGLTKDFQMTFEAFRNSLQQKHPPEGIGDIATSLWHDATGNWEAAHNIVQDIHSEDGSWVHAYLHRKEGDSGNAAYWYRKARKPFPSASLQDEWEDIVRSFLEN
jgi:hypothetical protein